MSWHVPEQLVAAYVEGAVRGARAASIEAHVLSCQACRAMVGAEVSSDRLESIWSTVVDEVDAPRRTWPERLLGAIGLPDTDARLIAAAPSLRLSWLASVGVVLLFAAWASNTSDRGATLFLILAPVIPVLAVAGAYGPRIDPTYEMSAATPYPTLRLILLRSATVVAVSGLLALAASTFVPDGDIAAAWLLPCLALVSLTLVLTRWVPLPVAAAGVAAVYALPLLSALIDNRDISAALLSPALQWAAAVVAVAALSLLSTDPHLRTALRRTP
ncbi:MAG: zf-HC2 domain-containing protein [Actinomycetes bacterium]